MRQTSNRNMRILYARLAMCQELSAGSRVDTPRLWVRKLRRAPRAMRLCVCYSGRFVTAALKTRCVVTPPGVDTSGCGLRTGPGPRGTTLARDTLPRELHC